MAPDAVPRRGRKPHGNRHRKRHRRTLSPDVLLALALFSGVVVGAAVVVRGADHSKAWPGTASQVLPTLVIALVVDRFLEDRSWEEESRAYNLLGGAIVWAVLFATGVSVLAASSGDGFADAEAALVSGTIVALTVLVLMRSASRSPASQRRRESKVQQRDHDD